MEATNTTFKTFARVMNLVLIVILFQWVQPSVCSSDCNTSYGLDTSNMLVYALEVREESAFTVKVTVYSKNCSDVDTVGPTWYRLDTVGSTGTSGRFYPPAIKSGAVIADDGIEFNVSGRPLVLLDLPRTYVYLWTFSDEVPAKKCFKLTIREGDACKEVLSSNCTEEETVAATTEVGQESDMETDSIITTEEQPGTITTEEQERSKPPTTRRPRRIIQDLETHCNTKHNCTGRRARGRLACGTDGKWYRNTCTLRHYICINELDNLQRDISGISCTGNSAPVPTAPPTTAPTTPPTATFPPDLCITEREEYIKFGLIPLECDANGLFRPIHCRRQLYGLTGIQCFCITPRSGNRYGEPWILPDCTDQTTTESPPTSHCRI